MIAGQGQVLMIHQISRYLAIWLTVYASLPQSSERQERFGFESTVPSRPCIGILGWLSYTVCTWVLFRRTMAIVSEIRIYRYP